MIMYRARRVDGPDGKPLDEADKLKAGILSSDAFEDAEPMPRVRIDDVDAWRALLVTKEDKQGNLRVVANLSNAVTCLRYHPAWRGVLGYDAFAERVVMLRPPPWHASVAPSETVTGALRDTDTARVIDWFARTEGLAFTDRIIEQAIPVVAEGAAFHPVRDYLSSLEWDGVPRLATWLSVYAGCEQSEYSAAIGTRWMISAVARAFEPGCQVDCMLIIQGDQGIGKSSLFRALVPLPSLYSETPITLGDKDSYQGIHGVWIYMLDELDSLDRGSLTRTKNFITSTKDHYRQSYGRHTRDHFRQNVFCGTTNKGDYLSDGTGNRRYWPETVVRPINISALVRDRDQLWAEAFERYANGEKWHVDTPALRALCEAQQAERLNDDPWEQFITEWLQAPSARGVDNHGKVTREPFDARNGVTTGDVLTHALGIPSGQITKAQEMRAADVLRALGYRKGKRATIEGVRARRFSKVCQTGQDRTPRKSL